MSSAAYDPGWLMGARLQLKNCNGNCITRKSPMPDGRKACRTGFYDALSENWKVRILSFNCLENQRICRCPDKEEWPTNQRSLARSRWLSWHPKCVLGFAWQLNRDKVRFGVEVILARHIDYSQVSFIWSFVIWQNLINLPLLQIVTIFVLNKKAQKAKISVKRGQSLNSE